MSIIETELMMTLSMSERLQYIHCNKRRSQIWKALQARDPASIATRNILAYPGVVGLTLCYLITGTTAQRQAARTVLLERDLRGFIPEMFSRDWKVDLKHVVAHVDKSSETGYRLEDYPWWVWVNHDKEMPGSHVARELNKMCRDTYYDGGHQTDSDGVRHGTFYFRDKGDAAKAKMFFGGSW